MLKVNYVKLSLKIRPEQIGCSEEYFKKHLYSKQLKIIYETPQHYIRVKDEQDEEWGLYPGQYVIDV